jgi:hypothetical protein
MFGAAMIVGYGPGRFLSFVVVMVVLLHGHLEWSNGALTV